MNRNTLNETEYSIYVIELDKKILELKKFRDANPAYNPEKPCVYVGYTSKTPEKRFEQHTSGAKSKKGARIYSKKVFKYGIRLKPRLYKSHNPMRTQEEAEDMEKEKARRLRKRGYGVWQK
jgi:predicted GIY-YIG superfamily endonuclease